MKQSSAPPVEKAAVRRALLSVFDKEGLLPFAKGLASLGVELLASGGTQKALAEAGLEVTAVEAFTKSPEVLGGRVKTLHPRIHAGILAHRGDSDHVRDLENNGYAPIDLVVCNLYPFAEVLAKRAPRAEMVENIDIGGPTLVRAAAKNADGGLTVLVDPKDYEAVLEELRQAKATSLALRRRLAARAFRVVATYDGLIADWCESDAAAPQDDALPTHLSGFRRAAPLRYGENPHQRAALYLTDDDAGGVAKGTQLQGKELSYNNYLDLDAAYRAVAGAGSERCCIVKHTNPCGIAWAKSQKSAFERALAGDPLSAFGGIIGFNNELSGETAVAIKASKLFVECIVAPSFSEEALATLKDRENLRLVTVPRGSATPAQHAHRIGGGLLVQDPDSGIAPLAEWKIVTKKQLEKGWNEELAFAMHVVMTLKSNAICVTKELSLRGAGAGQMSRIDATEQALKKAADQCKGAFLASDAFFPFDDSVRLAAKAGISAVIQPGGSKRDTEVIAACDELGLAMVFTGRRHFRH